MNKGTEINSSKKLIEHLQLHFPKRLAGGRPELNVPPNTVIKKVFKDYTFSGHLVSFS